MKAVVLVGTRELAIRDAPQPRIERDTDVLLKIEMAGVCGTDVHYYLWGRVGCQVVKFPHRIGHECAATVADIGGKVRRVKVGDRVAVEPAVSCGQCEQCLSHRRHTCRNLKFLGCPGQMEGCFAEFLVMPEGNCYPIRAATTFEQAALAEPLSIGIHSIRLAMPLKEARIAILGAGPIGLSVLLAAKLEGVAKAYVTDRLDARLAHARRAGADWTGNSAKQDIVKEILSLEPQQLDVVFECCGQQAALDQAVELLKPGGTLLVAGIPEPDRVSFSIDLLRRKELRIQNVRRQNECMQPALDLIESGKVSVDFMVTHRFTTARAQEAFELLADYRDGVVKAMIRIS